MKKFFSILVFFLFFNLSAVTVFEEVTITANGETVKEGDTVVINNVTNDSTHGFLKIKLKLNSYSNVSTVALKLGGSGDYDDSGRIVKEITDVDSTEMTMTVTGKELEPRMGETVTEDEQKYYLTLSFEDKDEEEDKNDDDVDAVTGKNYYRLYIKLDLTAPEKPSISSVTGGNEKLFVKVSYADEDKHGEDEDITKYLFQVTGYFKKDGEITAEPVTVKFSSSSSSSELTSSDGYSFVNADTDGTLNEKYTYSIIAAVVDRAGNQSEYSDAVTSMAYETAGLWKNYKSNEGTDDGGYCFIATAAYGSYYHPIVQALRGFRDKFLLTNAIGSKFVSLYYEYSPKMVVFMGKYPILKPIVKFILFPVAAIAWLILNPLFILLGFALFFVVRKFGFRKELSAIILVMAISFPSAAKASVLFTGDFGYENSFYYPSDIDKSASGTPVKDVLGNSNRYMGGIKGGIGFKTDYFRLVARTGASLTWMNGKALKSDGSKSSDETSFYLLPVIAEIRLRPEYSFPLKPFVYGGLDYVFWWIGEEGENAEAGGTMGWHIGGGVQLSLNFLDPGAAKKMEASTGITDTSLYVSYRLEKIDDFGSSKSFDLSDPRIEFGIIFEF